MQEYHDLIHTCISVAHDGWALGWHEANGGNLSVLIEDEQLDELCAELGIDERRRTDDSWHPLRHAHPQLSGRFVLVSASGSYFRQIPSTPQKTLGIIELSRAGDAWRYTAGYCEGARPTSELESHLFALEHHPCVYHAHPQDMVALSALIPAEDGACTRALWCTLTESIIMFPDGVASLPWIMPGSDELCAATAQALTRARIVLWAHHGVFINADNLTEAFGLMETCNKAAHMYLSIRSAAGSSPIAEVTREQLQVIAGTLHLNVRAGLL